MNILTYLIIKFVLIIQNMDDTRMKMSVGTGIEKRQIYTYSFLYA